MSVYRSIRTAPGARARTTKGRITAHAPAGTLRETPGGQDVTSDI
jgi:hypothetical protein